MDPPARETANAVYRQCRPEVGPELSRMLAILIHGSLLRLDHLAPISQPGLFLCGRPDDTRGPNIQLAATGGLYPVCKHPLSQDNGAPFEGVGVEARDARGAALAIPGQTKGATQRVEVALPVCPPATRFEQNMVSQTLTETRRGPSARQKFADPPPTCCAASSATSAQAGWCRAIGLSPEHWDPQRRSRASMLRSSRRQADGQRLWPIASGPGRDWPGSIPNLAFIASGLS